LSIFVLCKVVELFFEGFDTGGTTSIVVSVFGLVVSSEPEESKISITVDPFLDIQGDYNLLRTVD
jgi:hypothetical protein